MNCMKNVIDDLKTALEAKRIIISQIVDNKPLLEIEIQLLDELYREEGELLDCIKVLEDELSKRLRE